MSRTDKDTPWFVLSQRKENTVEYHDHTRSHIGAVSCSIDIEDENPRKKTHGSTVFIKHREKYRQHRESGRCKKAILTTTSCKHDIFGNPMNRTYCSKTSHLNMLMERRNGFSVFDFRQDPDISLVDYKEFIKAHGVVHEHTVSQIKYNEFEPCKCDAWLIFTPCEHELNLDTMPHGITGASRRKNPDYRGQTSRNERRIIRDELHEYKYSDWRNELDPVE